MREIISLHIGQAGIQVGSACWELYCLEHGLRTDGRFIAASATNDATADGSSSSNTSSTGMSKRLNDLEETAFHTFFCETSSHRYTPRALLVDLNSSSIDSLRTSASTKDLFASDMMLSGKSDAAGLYARGHYTCGRDMIEITMDRIRKLADQCEDLQGFMLFHSVGGGTGSGFSSLLLEKLSVEYHRKMRVALPIYPSTQHSAAVTEPYNAVLATHSLLEHSDCTYVFENSALSRICERSLKIDLPLHQHMNQVMSQAVSGITSSIRFDGSLNASLSEMQQNSVPYPRINFLMTACSPLYSSLPYESPSVKDFTIDAFDAASMMVDCDPSKGKFMAVSLAYRGDIVPKDVGYAVSTLKTKRTIQFVDWSPTGFKCGINYQPPRVKIGGDIALTNRTVCMIGNSSCISQVFARVLQKYDLMFAKLAFVHWYVGEDMEEGEFTESREDLAALMQDYEEIAAEPEEVPDEEGEEY